MTGDDDDGSLRPTRSMRPVRAHDAKRLTLALGWAVGVLVAVGLTELVVAAYLLRLWRPG